MGNKNAKTVVIKHEDSESDHTDYKIALLGDGAVGKSALISKYLQDNFPVEYDPTIEDNYFKRVYVDDKENSLDILDTAGQEEYECMRNEYIRKSDGFMLVYSIDKLESREEIRSLIQQIKRIKRTQNVPMILICNKIDLVPRGTYSSQEKFAKDLGVDIFMTSAKTGEKVALIFEELVRKIRDYKKYMAVQEIENTIHDAGF